MSAGAAVGVSPSPLEALARTLVSVAALVGRSVDAQGASPGADRATARALALHRLAGRVAELHGLRIAVGGELPQRASVLVCNHLGYWDGVVLGSILPLTAIAKSEVAGWPLLGRCGEALGVLYVRRGDAHHGARVLRRALRRLAAGVHVLNFPEGTTSDGSGLLPFRRGIFGVAMHASVPLVPVGLRLRPADAAWLGEETFLPHYRRHWQRGGRVDASVRFGSALRPGDFDSAEALAAAAHAGVAALLGGGLS